MSHVEVEVVTNTISLVPPPSVLIYLSPSASNNSYYAGTMVIITCSVLFVSSVDTAVGINVTWMKNSTGAVVGSDSSLSLPYHQSNYTSSIIFSPVGTGDSGVYTCGVTLERPAQYITLNVSSISNSSDYLHINCVW